MFVNYPIDYIISVIDTFSSPMVEVGGFELLIGIRIIGTYFVKEDYSDIFLMCFEILVFEIYKI